MPGEVDIANTALALIGSPAVVSLTDGSDKSNTINDLYPHIRDDMLRSHPWNFATKREKLAQSSTAPDYEFDHAYPLPFDWLRTIAVHNNDAGHGTIVYSMELIGTQRAIVSSADDIYLTYVARITDPNLMATDFIYALQLALGRDLAIPLASSNKLRQDLAIHSERALAKARSADSLGAFPQIRPRGSWASSRAGWRSDSYRFND